MKSRQDIYEPAGGETVSALRRHHALRESRQDLVQRAAIQIRTAVQPRACCSTLCIRGASIWWTASAARFGMRRNRLPRRATTGAAPASIANTFSTSTACMNCRSDAGGVTWPDSNAFVNGLLGGWQLSGIYGFISGAPLSIGVPGATLGNGRGTRANVTGDPRLSDGTADRWFDTAAFVAPAARHSAIPASAFSMVRAAMCSIPG